MLSKIKKFIIFIGIGFAVIFGAYCIGIKKGKQDEKIKNMEKVQKNIARAARTRALLRDSDFVRRLRRKYGRR